jgi:hypothetical protein
MLRSNSIFAKACFIGLLLHLSISSVNAQYHQRRLYRTIALEASMASRRFDVRSDMPIVDNLEVVAQGPSFGVVIGSEAITGRLKGGLFKSTRLVGRRVEVVEGEMGVNVFPLQLLKTKSKLLKPYSIISLERDNVKFFGNYEQITPPAAPGEPQAGVPAHPDCPQTSPPANPSAPAEKEWVTTEEEKLMGTIVTSRFNIGAGVLVHVPLKRSFVNLIAETRYGMAIGFRAIDPDFTLTRTSNQLAINVGLQVGILK